MKRIQICLLLMFNFIGYSQDYFERIISVEENVFEEGMAVVENNDFLYVAGNGFSSGPTKSYFLKFDTDGEMIWIKANEDIQNKGHNLIKLDSDKFLLTSKNWNINAQTTFMLDTLGNIERIDTCINNMVDGTTIATNVRFGRYYVTSTNAFQNNGENLNSVLCWHNLESGELDTMIIEDNGFNDQIGDLVVGPDSLLTVVYRYQDPEIKSDYYRSIHKFNKYKEKVWEWTSERLDGYTSFHGFTLAILEDGRMVHNNGRFTNVTRESPSIRAINPDGSLSWYYDFPVWLLPMPVEDFFIYNLFHLIRTENNDIVGCGWYDDRPNLKGYLFRMNSEGEMLWERYYYTDSIDYFDSYGYEYISGGQFFDVEELENGDLAVVGEKHLRRQEEDGSWTRDEDLWLLRLNADGCIGDYCGEDRNTTITSTTEEETKEEIVSLYPNPFESRVSIVLLEDCAVSIWSMEGVRIEDYTLQKGEHNLDLAHLMSGVHICKIQGKLSKRLFTKKLVKY